MYNYLDNINSNIKNMKVKFICSESFYYIIKNDFLPNYNIFNVNSEIFDNLNLNIIIENNINIDYDNTLNNLFMDYCIKFGYFIYSYDVLYTGDFKYKTYNNFDMISNTKNIHKIKFKFSCSYDFEGYTNKNFKEDKYYLIINEDSYTNIILSKSKILNQKYERIFITNKKENLPKLQNEYVTLDKYYLFSLDTKKEKLIINYNPNKPDIFYIYDKFDISNLTLIDNSDNKFIF